LQSFADNGVRSSTKGKDKIQPNAKMGRLAMRHELRELEPAIKQRGRRTAGASAPPFPSQGVPARGRVIIRNADNAITAALGRAA
jgi:hypothetical protein